MKADAIQRAKRVDEMARCARVMSETLEQFSRDGVQAQGHLATARSSLVQAARELEQAHDVLSTRDPRPQTPDPNPTSDTTDPIHRRD